MVLFQADATQPDGRLAARPKGASQKAHPGVAALGKGTTLPGERRLVVNLLGRSGIDIQFDTVH